MDASRDELDFERLAASLKALAHPARLELLWRLRHPASAGDIQLRPRRKDADLQAERPMSRQSILEHIEVLEGVGALNRLPDAAQWVTSSQRVFALIESMRDLTRIEPSTKVDVDATLAVGAAEAPRWAPGPRLVLANGPWEGKAFALGGEGPWTLGRSKGVEVALTYDPYASSEHATLEREGDGFRLVPKASARTPARVNFSPVAPGAPRRVAAGDLIGIGRSLLAFQAA